MVDAEVIREKLILLEEYINDLGEYRDLKLEELTSDKITFRYLERTLHLAVEEILYIGYHIISDERLCNPATNKETIKILAKNDIIKENIDDYIKMAQFRNIIVHDYVDIDPEILLRIIHENISDLKSIFNWYKEYIS